MSEDRNFGDKMRILIYLIILPLIFTLIGGTILAQTFGLIDLMRYARGIPVLGDYFPEREKDAPEFVDKEEELELWAEELEEREKNLAKREEEIEGKEEALLEFEEELSKFEQELDERKEQLDRREERVVDREERINELAEVYEDMRPRQAAEKIVELDDDLVVDIFMELPSDAKSGLLAELPGEDAGRYSSLLAGEREKVAEATLEERETELEALREELEAREEELERREDRVNRLAGTYEEMDPETAAELINDMMLTDKELVIQIFNQMQLEAAADILSAMPNEVALEIISAVGGDIEELEDQV